jgi:hypothetical protein
MFEDAAMRIQLMIAEIVGISHVCVLSRLDPREELAHHPPKRLRFFHMAHVCTLLEID